MNQTAFENRQSLKCKTPVIVLTLISLISLGVAATVFSFDIFSGLLSFICTLLLLLYVVKFHNYPKAAIIVPIILGWEAVSTFWYLISLSTQFGIFYTLLDVFMVIGFALATFSALKGLSNKVFLIIPFAFVVISGILSLITFFNICQLYQNAGLGVDYLVADFTSRISPIAFHTALFLFGLKNRIPVILTAQSKTPNAAELSPEQTLRLLKEKFDLGILTEEEYRVQRAEVIDKL